MGHVACCTHLTWTFGAVDYGLDACRFCRFCPFVAFVRTAVSAGDMRLRRWSGRRAGGGWPNWWSAGGRAHTPGVEADIGDVREEGRRRTWSARGAGVRSTGQKRTATLRAKRRMEKVCVFHGDSEIEAVLHAGDGCHCRARRMVGNNGRNDLACLLKSWTSDVGRSVRQHETTRRADTHSYITVDERDRKPRLRTECTSLTSTYMYMYTYM